MTAFGLQGKQRGWSREGHVTEALSERFSNLVGGKNLSSPPAMSGIA